MESRLPQGRPRAASERRAPAGFPRLPARFAIGDDRGQGLGEYALVLGFVAVLCAAAAAFVGSSIFTMYQNVSSTYP